MLFINTSLSEGLAFAIGEASLSGVPEVAIQVSATVLVHTDSDDLTKRYGEWYRQIILASNDPAMSTLSTIMNDHGSHDRHWLRERQGD